MRKIILTAIFPFIALACPLSRAGEIPLGIQLMQWESPNMPDYVRDSLIQDGDFNFCFVAGDTATGLSQARLDFFRKHGLGVVPYIGGDDTPKGRLALSANNAYMNSHYMTMQAEQDDSLEIRFRTNNGINSGGWCEAHDSIFNNAANPYILLDDLYYIHERNALRDVVNYIPFLRIRIDSLPIPSGITVAYLRVWGADSTDEWGTLNRETRHHRLIKEYTIKSDFFMGNNPGELEFGSPFGVPDTVYRTVMNGNRFSISREIVSSMVLTYQIVSTGRLPFAVDSFAVYNADGHNLASGLYDSVLGAYIHDNPDVIAYQLRDDMPYDMMLPAKHLDQLIRTASGGNLYGMWKPFLSAFSGDDRYEGPTGGHIPFRDFLKIAQPEKFWINQYPFWGVYCGNDTSGLRTSYSGNSRMGHTRGLQATIDALITGPLDSLKTIMSQLSDNTELWYTAQLQSQKPYSASCWGYEHRRPSGPEMSMEAFIALSYGVNAIQYWPYFTYTDGAFIYCGLDSVEFSSERAWCRYTEAWGNLVNYVVPNFKALEKYLTAPGMIWIRSYNSYQLADGYVKSISGRSDRPNPDSGWAQIGEFHKADTAFVLLVNRACNMEDGSEAPAQHFTLRFNPDVLNLGNYVLITDLADTVHYDSSAHEWVGDPRTTYSAVMPDGTIPYTITLRAGEGKLIKIAKTGRQRQNKWRR